MRTQASPPADRRLTLAQAANGTFAELYNIEECNTTFEPQLQTVYTPSSDHQFDFFDLLEGPLSTAANNGSGSQAPDIGACDSGTLGTFQPAPLYMSPLHIPDRNTGDHITLSKAGASQADAQLLEERRGHVQHLSQLQHQYNSPNFSSVCERQYTEMTPTSYLSNGAQPPQPDHRASQYEPFRGMFQDSQSAHDYRATALRFGRMPYRPPDSDPTIGELKNSRQVQVKRIYDAMTRSDAAKDNPGSIAMRRWAHTSFYPAQMVEAYAHKVFDCLLEQAEKGFRGWHHNDYASDDRKGEPEDKNVSCSERLENILQGLEEEKTICEDVITSACQIRMFVNAPRAYARRKEANRHGNSKRGKALSGKPEPGTRSSRARKLSMRQANRSRQSTPCAPTSASANAKPAHQDIRPTGQVPLPEGPYYHLAHAQHLQPVPGVESHYNNQSPCLQGYSVSSTSMSPPQQAARNSPFTNGPPQSYGSPSIMSPSPMPNIATIASPGVVNNSQYVEDSFNPSWNQADLISDSSYNILLQSTEGFNMDTWGQENATIKSTETAPQEHTGSRVDPTLTDSLDDELNNTESGFREYWTSQHNFHPLPHGHRQ